MLFQYYKSLCLGSQKIYEIGEELKNFVVYALSSASNGKLMAFLAEFLALVNWCLDYMGP